MNCREGQKAPRGTVLALVTSSVTIYELLKRRTPQPGGVGVRASDLRSTGGGEWGGARLVYGRWVGGGGARDRNTPRTYERRADL